MRRLALSAAVVLLLAGPAQALTVRDIIDLTKAGLGEEVLLALIEVDGSMFSIDPQTLTSLKAAGVSEKVIVALVRSGRAPSVSAQAASSVAQAQALPEPDVVYVERPPATIVREVAVPVPVYVPVAVSSHRTRAYVREHVQSIEPSITAPPLLQGPHRYQTDTPPPPPDAKPVYWGFGGKLRPDAWKPQ